MRERRGRRGRRKREPAGGERRTVEQVGEENEHVLDDVGLLGGRLEDALVVGAAEEEEAVGIELGLDQAPPQLGLLGLVDGAQAGVLLVGEEAGADGAVPGDRPLADVALQRGQVGGRIERHGGRAAGRGHREGNEAGVRGQAAEEELARTAGREGGG